MEYTPENGFPYYFDLVKNEHLKPLFASSSTIAFLSAIEDFQKHLFTKKKTIIN